MKNNVQLIAYVDRLTGSNINALHQLLTEQFKQLFSGVHLLPFYYPIDGSDAGFDPINHSKVDQRLGDWQNVYQLGTEFDLMADLIVNHVSAQSEEFIDVLEKGNQSAFWELFITETKIFPQGMSESEQDKIYRPRPGKCFSTYTLANGTDVEFWTTFTKNQIDIDVTSPAGQRYLENILTIFSQNNIKMLRLDAAGYAIKKANTSCFMLPETYDFIDDLTQKANQLGMATLVEIHAYYKTQIEIAKRVDHVYDFALPPLVLHTLFEQDHQALVHWLEISPKNCITVLDTHDGIGIIDVGPIDNNAGLLTPTEIDRLVVQIHTNSNNQSLKATGSAASNVDIYQVNCSYYDALARNDYQYLLARAIQFFSPGIPQVYYAGLLAQTNDMSLLNKTNVGRDINRPYLDAEQIYLALQKPVVKALMALISIRNQADAFDGEFSIISNAEYFTLRWQKTDSVASLLVNLTANIATITLVENNQQTRIELSELLMKYRAC